LGRLRRTNCLTPKRRRGALGLQLRALPASSTGEIDAAFDLIGREQILALIVSADRSLT
jgi:hypothetical protein